MQLLTPARLATLVGVLTGLSAAATALLDVFPKDTPVGRTIVAATGVIATVISVAKFLEGQAGWEQQKAQHAHDLKTLAVQHYDAKVVVGPGLARPVVVPRPASDLPKAAEAPSEAELPGEEPLGSIEDAAGGEELNEVGGSGEPKRLENMA